MDLSLINLLKKEFGEQYVTSNELFRKSVNTVATPAMGHSKATLWIIVDNCRGEDVVRRHYEAMLKFDEECDGQERNIDPYGGPQALVHRLKAQGYNMEFTILPPDFDNKAKYIELKAREFRANEHDIQAVCYNLDDRVMPTNEMEQQA